MQDLCQVIANPKTEGLIAVTLFVEDFFDETASIPLSSIPVQFSIDVKTRGTVPCDDLPVFTGATPDDGDAMSVSINQPFEERLQATTSDPDIP